MPELNQPAPEFSLFKGKGDKLSLSDLRGQKVVIAFVPAAFTGICTKELCDFRDSLASFNDLNAQVVAISVDGLFSNLAWAKEHGLTFPVLSDYTRAATHAYGVALENFAGMEGYTTATRSVFVVNEEGTLTFQWIGTPGDYPPMDEVKAALA